MFVETEEHRKERIENLYKGIRSERTKEMIREIEKVMKKYNFRLDGFMYDDVPYEIVLISGVNCDRCYEDDKRRYGNGSK